MQEELRIEDLDLVHNDQAQIAYLSACSTAEIKQASLVDENIHLASSFLLSGFPHVIASQWKAHDGAAVAIAREFYKCLFERGEFGDDQVADSLHRAVLEYRSQNGNIDNIAKWATFVHFGT